MIIHTHNTSLALAAIVVSIVAAITGLALMNNIRMLPESRRKAVIVMAAFLMGGGIWSMHFLAMLSIQFPVPIHYDLLQTLSSGLIAILVVGFALLLLHFRNRTPIVLNSAGLCLGVGIASMHVVGMLGMRGVIPEFNMAALFFAFIFALVMGVTAIRVSYGSRSKQNIIRGGVLFGLSVVVVHHTAMIGTHFSVDPDYQQLTIALDQGAMAIAVTVTAFIICGTFLLAASTFVPTIVALNDDRITVNSCVDTVESPVVLNNLQTTASHSEPIRSNPMEELTATSLHQPADKELVKHALDNRQVKSRETPVEPSLLQASFEKTSQALDIVDSPRDQAVPIKVPYEQQKRIFFVDSDQVGAIRADGRYTQLYTRDGVKFCPWSITEAEKRLKRARFFRSHRSYLINMSEVASLEKNRDSGVCRFEGFTHLGNVPVSRTRIAELFLELGL